MKPPALLLECFTMSRHISEDELIAFWTDPENSELHLQAFTAHLNLEHGLELKAFSVRQRLYKIKHRAEKLGFETPPIPKSMRKAGRPRKNAKLAPEAYRKYFKLSGDKE